MNDVIVKTDNVTKIYVSSKVKTFALNGISLEIPRGSFSCIIGPSGCGKSTLLHLLGALDKPTSGRISIDGSAVEGMGSDKLAGLRACKIGFVFQFFNLLPNLTALENIETAMLFSGKEPRRDGERALGLLSAAGISHKAKAKPGEMSGGEQQRVAIARALSADPPILLMDEPTGNLDSESEKGVMSLILELNRRGKTMVLVTHNAEIAKKAEIVFSMKDGRLVEFAGWC
jgi:putative ABC transport system ATP-binding protein